MPVIRKTDRPSSSQRPAWRAELARRSRHRFVLKTVGICGFIWVFFICYFHLLRNPVHPVTAMPVTALDRLIPFQPQALIPYLSLWIYLGIAPGLMLALRDLVAYGLWIAAMCVAGLLCFYALPTTVPPLELDVSGYAGFAMLQGVDANGNACPSLHVATAIFTAIWVEYLLRRLQMPWGLRAGSALWCLAIVYSTMAIKQHVALDVLAGAALGTVFAMAALRWRPRGGADADF
jgi:membrane-associated phospholipid phosphatase